MASHSNSFSSDDSDVPLAEILTKRRRIARGNLSEDSSDSSEEIRPFHRLSTRGTRILSSSEDEDTEPSINNITTSHIDWADPIGNQPRLSLVEYCYKPKVIVDYNEGKSSVDISDQMASYCSPLRKSVKWYKKIVFELCLNTAVVNSWIIYNSLTNRKITSIEFRKKLAMNLMSCNNNNSP
ncbi:unnamed protein product [Larinioides sclopetarius]|uniref:PiggyBac transposable element-derived protein domain-containing protein n=1 Tax=Larinioides sclopetarius TaxID=280406 RepID=A0AAV1ZW01_9ARAC